MIARPSAAVPRGRLTAPGADALLRRLEALDPPAVVVIVATDVHLPPDLDPRAVPDVAVLELAEGIDPDVIDWSPLTGLPAVIVGDELACSPARLSAALVAGGATGVRITCLGTGPRAGGVR